MLVTDLPIWEDHPWSGLIPDTLDVRREGDLCAIVSKHSDGSVRAHVSFSLPISIPQLAAVLTNFGVSNSGGLYSRMAGAA